LVVLRGSITADVDNHVNIVYVFGTTSSNANVELWSAVGITNLDPKTLTVDKGYDDKLNVERLLEAIEILTGLKAIPSSVVDRDNTTTFCVAKGTFAPDRNVTPTADNVVPIKLGVPVF
jgi:hypothetical protein